MNAWEVTALIAGWYFVATIVVRFMPKSWLLTGTPDHPEWEVLDRALTLLASPVLLPLVAVILPLAAVIFVTAYAFVFVGWLVSPPESWRKFWKDNQR